MDQDPNLLGSFLKERRARLDPASYGLPLARRRTPGLRREEVAQLAHVSPTWYTWLEQGRGGAPSAEVLDRLARAFSLTGPEREHLYLLAQSRLPKVHRSDPSGITPQLQRILDALEDSPAILKTPEWTVVAWNKAASAVLADYAGMPDADRNVLRMIFRRMGDSRFVDWDSVARGIVNTVRRDVLRAGMNEETRALVEELSRESPEFRAMWAEQEVPAFGEGAKRIRHPVAGLLDLEYSIFAVDGRPDLALVIFNPATPEDRRKVRELIAAQPEG